MSNFNLSVESMALIYPMMFMFGLVSYFTYKLTNMYYTNLIDNNYDKKSENNLSKYYVMKFKLLNNSEVSNEDNIESCISNLMSKLNSVCVYRYYDRLYFVMIKDNAVKYSIGDIKDTLTTLSEDYSFYINYIGFDLIKNNQLLKYFKNLFYRNKFLWAKRLSKKYNIPFKNKNVDNFIRRNLNKFKNELPTYGQFYKFNNSAVISFKLFSLKTQETYERLITVKSIELDLLKIFSAIDEHYIENTDVKIYQNDNESSEDEKKLDEFDDLIKSIVKNVLESETDESLEATIIMNKK